MKAFCYKKPPGNPQELSSMSLSHIHAHQTYRAVRQARAPGVGMSQNAIWGWDGQLGRGSRAVCMWGPCRRGCRLKQSALWKPGCQQMWPTPEGQGSVGVGGGWLDGLEVVPEGLVWRPIRGSFIHISLPSRSNKKYLVFWPPASQRQAGSMLLNA